MVDLFSGDSATLSQLNHPGAVRHPSTGGEFKAHTTQFPSRGGVPPAGGGVVPCPTAPVEGFFLHITVEVNTIL